MYQRRRIDTLLEGSKELESLRRGFDALEKAGSLAKWADVHVGCPHGREAFLPWHRAYLFAFEQALRTASGDASLTLPYWDWIETPYYPAQVLTGALRRDRFDAATRPKEYELPTADMVRYAQGLPRFPDYGGKGPPKRRRGCLEDVHGLVHYWVGKDMAIPERAAYDPIFFFHHAFVDKLWAEWQTSHSENPVDLDATLDGVPGKWKVREVLNISSGRLGYEYIDDYRVLSTNVQLSMREPHRTQGAVGLVGQHLFLDLLDVRVSGAGAPPAVIEVSRVGMEGVLARISLFGQWPSARARHHHEEHDVVSMRTCLGLLPTLAVDRGLQLRLVNDLPAAQTAAIAVGMIVLVSV